MIANKTFGIYTYTVNGMDTLYARADIFDVVSYLESRNSQMCVIKENPFKVDNNRAVFGAEESNQEIMQALLGPCKID
jgi:hypothetical protein